MDEYYNKTYSDNKDIIYSFENWLVLMPFVIYVIRLPLSVFLQIVFKTVGFKFYINVSVTVTLSCALLK